MLEQLFGSRTRTKLLHLFLTNTASSYFVREITREVDERINSVRRELDNLENFGLLTSLIHNQKKYYQLNKDFVLTGELKALIDKSRLLAEKFVVEKVRKLEGLKYLILTGRLVGAPEAPVDVLLVGTISKESLDKFIKELEKIYRLELRYTHLTTKEYNYRKSMTDKFLYTVINSPKMELINRL